MKKLSSSLPNMVIVLTVITLIAGGTLAWVNGITSPQIERIQQENLVKGIRSVMFNNNIKVDNARKKDDYTFYIVNDKEGKFIGTAVISNSQGFGGTLSVLVGFNPQGTILGYTILSNSETPGLGAKVKTWFQKKQKGDIIGKHPGECAFAVSKDGGDIDAITASTITSRAFLNAIQQAYDTFFKTNNR